MTKLTKPEILIFLCMCWVFFKITCTCIHSGTNYYIVTVIGIIKMHFFLFLNTYYVKIPCINITE